MKAVIDELIREAFSALQHDSSPDEEAHRHLEKFLRNKFRATLKRHQADRIADLERQLAELRQPTAQQVEDAEIGRFLMGVAKQNSETSWPRLHKIAWSGYAVTNQGDGYRDWTLREALRHEIHALQAGKEKE